MIIPLPRRQGRAAQFDALLRPHLPRLYRFAYRLSGRREDAEDLVQELCVKLYPRLDELRNLDQPAPWLARALYHHFVDQARRRARSPVEFDDELAECASEEPGPEELAQIRLDAEHLLAALALLAPEQRAVLAWHDMEGYTLEELSAREGVPLGTLKSRLHRARARLRSLLREPFPAAERVRD